MRPWVVVALREMYLMPGRGLHSSTFQLNLSRFLSLNPPTATEYPQCVLTLSRQVDECKALVAGETVIQQRDMSRELIFVRTAGAYTRPLFGST